MAEIKLKFNGTTYNVLCNSVSVSGTKSVDVSPYSNIGGPVEGQTNSYENLTIIISGIKFSVPGRSDILTWSAAKSMYKHAYNTSGTGVNGPITLNITYGDSTVLTGLNDSVDIKVLMKSFSLPISASDSKNGYMPVGNITFVETA